MAKNKKNRQCKTRKIFLVALTSCTFILLGLILGYLSNPKQKTARLFTRANIDSDTLPEVAIPPEEGFAEEQRCWYQIKNPSFPNTATDAEKEKIKRKFIDSLSSFLIKKMCYGPEDDPNQVWENFAGKLITLHAGNLPYFVYYHFFALSGFYQGYSSYAISLCSNCVMPTLTENEKTEMSNKKIEDIIAYFQNGDYLSDKERLRKDIDIQIRSIMETDKDPSEKINELVDMNAKLILASNNKNCSSLGIDPKLQALCSILSAQEQGIQIIIKDRIPISPIEFPVK